MQAYLLLVQLSKVSMAAAVTAAGHVWLFDERVLTGSPRLPVYQRSIKSCQEVVIVGINLGVTRDLPVCRSKLLIPCLAHVQVERNTCNHLRTCLSPESTESVTPVNVGHMRFGDSIQTQLHLQHFSEVGGPTERLLTRVIQASLLAQDDKTGQRNELVDMDFPKTYYHRLSRT